MIKDAILLAGGLASRLGPVTQVTNKHLLPIYDKPMIFYGLETLQDIGVENVTIILGGNSVGEIVNLVKDGSAFNLNVTYKYQQEPKGIAHAIYLAQNEILGRRFIVLLGDNVFGNRAQLKQFVSDWERLGFGTDALVVTTTSDNPHHYGQPLFDKENRIIDFVEKNKTVQHNKVVPGFYGLSTSAFMIIEDQHPSERGELEIVDTLREYVGYIIHREYTGFYTDCGTPDGLLKASNYFAPHNGSVGQ